MAREYAGDDGWRHVEKTVTIRRSPVELYQAWRHLERLPLFMEHVVSVTVDGMRTHWVVKAPGGTVEWDAELTADVPGQLIAWRTLGNADISHTGAVQFARARQGRGTEMRVSIAWKAPAGAVGAKVATLAGENPKQQLDDDLHRFKQLVEGGGIPTTRGQSRGEEQKKEYESEREPAEVTTSHDADAAWVAPRAGELPG